VPAPLALIPEEQVQTVEPEDPEILAVVEMHNATAARYNEHISERAKWLARIRLPTRASRAKRKRDDLRTMIRDRIEEYGLDDVIATVKAYGLIAYHESEVRGWYGSRMYSERSFAICRSQVAAGTSKRFKTERERVAWQMQHAGRQEIATYQSTIVAVDEGMPIDDPDGDWAKWSEDFS
jgi:hypothetical protein